MSYESDYREMNPEEFREPVKPPKKENDELKTACVVITIFALAFYLFLYLCIAIKKGHFY